MVGCGRVGKCGHCHPQPFAAHCVCVLQTTRHCGGGVCRCVRLCFHVASRCMLLISESRRVTLMPVCRWRMFPLFAGAVGGTTRAAGVHRHAAAVGGPAAGVVAWGGWLGRLAVLTRVRTSLSVAVGCGAVLPRSTVFAAAPAAPITQALADRQKLMNALADNINDIDESLEGWSREDLALALGVMWTLAAKQGTEPLKMPKYAKDVSNDVPRLKLLHRLLLLSDAAYLKNEVCGGLCVARRRVAPWFAHRCGWTHAWVGVCGTLLYRNNGRTLCQTATLSVPCGAPTPQTSSKRTTLRWTTRCVTSGAP